MNLETKEVPSCHFSISRG